MKKKHIYIQKAKYKIYISNFQSISCQITVNLTSFLTFDIADGGGESGGLN